MRWGGGGGTVLYFTTGAGNGWGGNGRGRGYDNGIVYNGVYKVGISLYLNG